MMDDKNISNKENNENISCNQTKYLKINHIYLKKN